MMVSENFPLHLVCLFSKTISYFPLNLTKSGLCIYMSLHIPLQALTDTQIIQIEPVKIAHPLFLLSTSFTLSAPLPWDPPLANITYLCILLHPSPYSLYSPPVLLVTFCFLQVKLIAVV